MNPANCLIVWANDREVNGYHVLLTAMNGKAHATKGEHNDILSVQNLRQKE
jgi:hypothetical protein